jgi:hypothetical protein
MTRRAVVIAIGLTAARGAFGQFYAPKTDYHDPVQRVFVVEAARVLAWWTEPTGSKLSEVTYDLSVKPDQTVVWSVRCWNPAHEPVKEAVVTYAPQLLKGGAEFYRSVFKQLTQTEWKPAPALGAGIAVDRYWQGAARAGLAREENLLTAARLVGTWEKKPGGSESMPELAGLLSHTALSSFGESVTLDRVLLARAAAWLCMTEQASGEKLESLWAPILFQAGRYQAAAKVWESGGAAGDKATAQQEGWNVWLRNPKSKDIYAFAATPTNFAMALPMLAWDAKVNGSGPSLVAMLEELAGGRARLQSVHNYAPFFAQDTTVRGGSMLEGLWPVYERLAWLRLLGAYPARTNEYRAYLGPLRAATNAMGQALTIQGSDNSLKGFRETIPLLHLAQQEGVGKLAPTAAATTRDLLNYGWEATGWQMGTRHLLLQATLPQNSRQIYDAVLPELEGLGPFFSAQQRGRRGGLGEGTDLAFLLEMLEMFETQGHIRAPKTFALDEHPEYLARFELIEGLMPLAGFTPPAAEPGEKEGEAGRRLARRCWLRYGDFELVARALWDEAAYSDLISAMNEYSGQGGALATVSMLRYLSELNEDEFQKLPEAREMQVKLAQSLPEPSLTQADAFFDSKFRSLDAFGRAQAYEQMFWQNPDSGLDRSVIFNYIISGSFKSAKRFYTQARTYFQDPVRVSSYSGKQVFLMAWCQNDAALRKQALKDSECGSRADLMMRIWDAAIVDDTNRLERAAQEFCRYEPGGGKMAVCSRLINFLPLLPGLRTASNPAREDALDYWEGDTRCMILAFMWVDKFKLQKPQAVRLLGGTEGDNSFRDFLLSYLVRDKQKALADLNDLITSAGVRTEEVVLAACLYNRLEALAPPHDEPDLKPAEVTSLKQVVQEKKRGKGQKAAGGL